ncbi:hypothetical protein [Sulfuriferula thiophila]|uniref:hypothetical protein n=1 Tax=Sulfuriferula thiophila TaxID=1781211 RepID=UPI000F60B1CD|nr:hypothetical protein [Sulfuriferula thiophila]
MENWELWRPRGCENVDKSIGEFYRIEATGWGLSIELKFVTGLMRMSFRKVLAYRTHLEECVPDIWIKIHSQGFAQNSFLEVKNSDWISALNVTGGLALYSNARHFSLVTEENFIEILTEEEPLIIWEF